MSGPTSTPNPAPPAASPAGHPLDHWFRSLSPKTQRTVVLIGGGTAVLAALASVVMVDDAGSKPTARRQELVANILTEANPRELGIDGIAEQLRDLRNHTEQTRRSLDTLQAEIEAREDRKYKGVAWEQQRFREELTDVRTLLGQIQTELGLEIQAAKDAVASAASSPALDATGASARQPLPSVELDRLFDRPAPTARPGLEPPRGGEAVPTLEIRVIGAAETGSASTPSAAARADGLAPGAGAAATAPDETSDAGVFVSAGAILRGVLITGMDAPTGRQARRDPQPVLVRLKHEAILPNRFRADIRECFLIAAGYGDLSAERAYLRTETLSCVREDGGAIEVAIDGYAVGEDGKLGMRGRLVSKQGQVLAQAMMAGFAKGFGSVFSQQSVPVLSTAPTGQSQFQSVLSADSLQAGAIAGAGDALDRMAGFYLDMAEQMFPVIEVDAGRQVEIVLSRGVGLRIRG